MSFIFMILTILMILMKNFYKWNLEVENWIYKFISQKQANCSKWKNIENSCSSSFASFFLKYKNFLGLGLKSSTFQNIRTFVGVDFYIFLGSESSLLKVFILRATNFHFPKYKKNIFLKIYKKVFFLGAKKFYSPKYKKNFS